MTLSSRKGLKRSLSLFLVFLSVCLYADASDGWFHLELGAGNYGTDGHTKTALTKTCFPLITRISDAQSDLDLIDDVGTGDYLPEEQYAVLFWTLDALVERYGPVGMFHVNDLIPEYADYATEKLMDYARARGYDDVIIEALPGDYTYLNTTALIPHGRNRYTSVHLKNVECSFYHDQMDGYRMLSSESSRNKARARLQHLANLSETGLYFFTLYHEYFFPVEEVDFCNAGIFYEEQFTWPTVPYIFPEGGLLELPSCVLFIPASD